MRTTTKARNLRHLGARLLVVGAVWSGFGLVCGPAAAQQAKGDPSPLLRQVSIDARKTSLLSVVSRLMKQVHASYTLDGQLQDAPIGAIHLEKVPFQLALEVVLKASSKPATYRVEAGVFMVVAQLDQPETSQGSALPGQPGLTQGSAQTPPRGEVKVSSSPDLTSDQPRVRLQCQNADLYTALKSLFTQVQAQYILEPSLHSIYITASINQPFRTALETLLRASGQPLTYRLENDVYSIVPKTMEETVGNPAILKP